MSVLLEISFSAEVIYWRGPAPHHFVALPPKQAAQVAALSQQLTYGWGAIPVDVSVGGIDFYTALFPKDGGYHLPLKKAVRESLGIELGDTVKVKASFTVS